MTPMSASVRGRYAPTPSGPLHLGNLRTALLAWLQVRLQGGEFILRIEDIDLPRTQPGATEQMLYDLRWMGLDWDEGPEVGGPNAPYIQSQRLDRYERHFKVLHQQQRLFHCYCSRKDIEQATRAPHGKQAVYPGTCRVTPRPKPGKQPAWRYRVWDKLITFEDQILGPFRHFLADETGDFVVRRADGLFAYHLVVVIDDMEMGVTDVVRGEDLLDSTPRQVELFHALNSPAPRYWHVPLMLDEQGRRLAKREASESLEALRERGWSPERVIGFLAAGLGLVDPGQSLSAAELRQSLTLDDLIRALAPKPMNSG